MSERDPSEPSLSLSGETIRATYRLHRGADEVEPAVMGLCVEQTVEFPLELIDREEIREQVVAHPVRIEPIAEDVYEVTVAFAVEVAGGELTQLINMLFGNISLVPGVRLVDLELPEGAPLGVVGPRFGRAGLRELTGVSRRPLLATALKPMGLSPRELARLARQFAEGGIDLIKDDHGLADQPFCPFDERVRRCAEAVAEVNALAGRRCLYFPNVTAPVDRIAARASRCREVGASGMVVSPGIIGLDGMARLAADDGLALPIMSHPAFQGALTVSPMQGISQRVIFGLFNRLAGADVAIFPSFGGRFCFTEADCRELVEGTSRPLGPIAPIFPAPAGGMSLDRVPSMIEHYGLEVVLLIGGDLHRHGADLVEGCRRFVEVVERQVSY